MSSLFLKELLENDYDASLVQSQLSILIHLHEEAITLHEPLMKMIPEMGKDKQKVWFASINKYNKGGIEDVKWWHSETNRPFTRHVTNNKVERLPNNKKCENPANFP